MLVSLDIETATTVDTESAAPHPHLSQITCVGVRTSDFEAVFRDLGDLQTFIDKLPAEAEFVGHNFQFDLKHLSYHGVTLPLEKWKWDTKIMAGLMQEKIPKRWIELYEEKRVGLNKTLPRGVSYRKAGPKSLKTLAPYFLEVRTFWETPENYDNDEYVLKDVEYTYRLKEIFEQKLRDEKLLNFYTNKLMPWARMLTAATIKGIRIDTDLLENKTREAETKTEDLKRQLDSAWAGAYKAYRDQRIEEVVGNYREKLTKALDKAKDPEKCRARYEKLQAAAIEKIPYEMNLDSPKQLSWLLKDHCGYDITNFSDEESTGKEVLQKLSEGHEDVKLFYEYRKQKKLCTAFFPTYRKLQDNGIIRCSFNVDGTRTGRLSSSDPNLQQVSGDIHDLFVARMGYKLITLDLSAIEPTLIAYMTEDEQLCQLLIEGGDFHGQNAVIMFGLECESAEVKELFPYERKVAKEVGLAMMYGAGARRIQQSAMKYGFDWSLNKCREIHKNFKRGYSEVFEYKQILDVRAERGDAIENLFGRSHKYSAEEVFMKAFNTQIQSSASDLLLDSQYSAEVEYKKANLDAQLLLVVHDEAVTEVAAEQVKPCLKIKTKCMGGYELNTRHGTIPIKVEGTVADCWEK